MAVLGTLLTATGTSVAKILLKNDLSGSEVGEMVGEELMDIAAEGLRRTVRQRAVPTLNAL